MEQVYTKKKNLPDSKPQSRYYRDTAPVMPNSLLLAMQNGKSGNKHNSELENIMNLRINALRHQIPSAENEADRLSAGITSGTPEQVKKSMGERLGTDFSSVQFHTGESTTKKADDMGARAWTQGNDVYFGEGGFSPSLAAHELVHTAQQGAVVNATVNVSAPMGGVQMCKKPNGDDKNDNNRDKRQRDEEEKQQEPLEHRRASGQQEHSAFEELYADEVDNDVADEGHCEHKYSDLNDYKHPNDLKHIKGRNKRQRDEEEKQQEPIEHQRSSEQQEHSAFEELHTDENDNKRKTLRELMEDDEDSEEDDDTERIENARLMLKLHAEKYKKKRAGAQNHNLDRHLYPINEHWFEEESYKEMSSRQPDESINDSENSNELKETNNQANNEDWERSAFEEEKKSNETQKKR